MDGERGRNSRAEGSRMIGEMSLAGHEHIATRNLTGSAQASQSSHSSVDLHAVLGVDAPPAHSRVVLQTGGGCCKDTSNYALIALYITSSTNLDLP